MVKNKNSRTNTLHWYGYFQWNEVVSTDINFG